MNFLFIHQNFPGQYLHLAKHLVAAGHDVRSITQNKYLSVPGVLKLCYEPSQRIGGCHTFVRPFNSAIENAHAVATVCKSLSVEGYEPDIVIGHNGWGEILFLKDMWPSAPLLGYFEFFYHQNGADVGFDPEFPPEPDDAMRLRPLNAVNMLGLHAADWGQTPTHWQRSGYPEEFQDRISVIHEGIDTAAIRPSTTAGIMLRDGRILTNDHQVITYSARNLEPYRGFHIFMRALPKILAMHPNVHVVIIGGDKVSYSRPAKRAPTYREQMLQELKGKVDLTRTHFVGRLPFEQYVNVLQISSVHVYLTYPFVLSWSLLEAMAAGCLLVCSRTPPVEEVVQDGYNGYLVDFFDTSELIERVHTLLRAPSAHNEQRLAARATVRKRYDLKTICLPEQLRLVEELLGRPL